MNTSHMINYAESRVIPWSYRPTCSIYGHHSQTNAEKPWNAKRSPGSHLHDITWVPTWQGSDPKPHLSSLGATGRIRWCQLLRLPSRLPGADWHCGLVYCRNVWWEPEVAICLINNHLVVEERLTINRSNGPAINRSNSLKHMKAWNINQTTNQTPNKEITNSNPATNQWTKPTNNPSVPINTNQSTSSLLNGCLLPLSPHHPGELPPWQVVGSSVSASISSPCSKAWFRLISSRSSEASWASGWGYVIM